MSAVDDILADARRRLRRLEPVEAFAAQQAGALLVDIRPVMQRRRFGQIPGALVIERNVLEWRLDPTGPDRHPGVGDEPRQVIVVCQEGYASSLAAASLQSMGLDDATDLRGGYAAWSVAGLPTVTLAVPEPDIEEHLFAV
jgi:rhodanese-related sulfurtransferase